MPQKRLPGTWYSVGIHPWDTDQPICESQWVELEKLARDAQVAAIGECGLDALRGGDSAVQEEVFRRQVAIAEKVEKFLVIHCVRRYGRLMDLRRELQPKQRWIVHGFCGKPELARQLTAAGIELSLRPGCPREQELRAIKPEIYFYNETD